MKRRDFIAGLGGAVSVGHAARAITPGKWLVADHMTYRTVADEGYDYDDVEHDP